MSVKVSGLFCRRGGRVMKLAQEHYLRSDIGCGWEECGECVKSLKTGLDKSAPIVVLDTNILLHTIQIMENEDIKNLVLLQIVMEETKANNTKTYERARRMIDDPAKTSVFFGNEHHVGTFVENKTNETVNDRNDRAIRWATFWYVNHLKKFNANVMLVTNDVKNKELAEQMGLPVYTLVQYLEKMMSLKPEQADVFSGLLEQVQSKSNEMDSSSNETYAPHLSASELEKGISSGRFFTSKLRANKKYWAEGWCSIPGKETEVHIKGAYNMNRAIDGDSVVVELTANTFDLAEKDVERQVDATAELLEDAEESTNLPCKSTGRVVGIAQRNWRQLCGSLQETDLDQGHALFVAIDPRYPKIRIFSRQIQSLMDKRIVVVIDDWPTSSHYPIGHYVRTVGMIGDRNTETEVIMLEHGVTEAIWSNSVLKCLPPPNDTISLEEISRRNDLRNECIFSIDPVGCKDIDDALHCNRLPNGNFEVGVHIADVSHYIQPESALDLEAAERATSVYLVERRIDMLPDLLSTNMCSLIANADRLTFSVIWEMNSKAEILNTRFCKSVIHSKAAMAYKDAQKLIDKNAINDVFGSHVIDMNNLARQLKTSRIGQGSLTLASPAVKFMLDSESAVPNDVELYELTEAHALVEEFMLLANISVAKFITESFPQYALLRRHPTPAPHFFDSLLKSAGSIGLELHTESSKALAESLDAAHIPGYPYFNTLLRILTTRCMTQAVYFCSGDTAPSEFHHYGLAAPIYTHFTSPIRRYADIIVHRLLAASLNLAPLPLALENRERMNKVADKINHRHRMAQYCGRASVNLHTLIFFREKKITTNAVVMNVRSGTIFVLVPKYGMEVPIKFGNKEKPDEWIFNEETLTLSGPTFTFKVFDQLLVKIYVEELKFHRQKLVVEVFERQPAMSDKISKTKDEGPEMSLNEVSKGTETQMEIEDETSFSVADDNPLDLLSRSKKRKNN